MWARTRLKIGWRDLAAGAWGCLIPGSRSSLTRRVEGYWGDGRGTVAAYSVRSGFDLMIQALELETDDEVIFSALNVKGMIKIARRSGLTPVPLDLDIAHFGPSVEQLERAITPRSKVLVVAHLFGTLLELDAFIACARRHGLLVVEDCAQAFDGRAFSGHPDADLSMFSFGPLKTSTSLGGALIRVKDAELRDKMRAIQAEYPVQKSRAHFKRVVQFAGLKILTSRLAMGALYRFFSRRGKDYESALADRVRSVAPLGSAKKLRYLPSKGMLRLLARRLRTFREGSLAARARKGRLLRDLIGDAVVLPGQANEQHNYWVFPLLVDEPRAFIDGLRREGFDGSNLPKSQAVAAPEGREHLAATTATQALADLIIVPCYEGISDKSLKREAEVIKSIAARVGSDRTKGYADVTTEATA